MKTVDQNSKKNTRKKYRIRALLTKSWPNKYTWPSTANAEPLQISPRKDQTFKNRKLQTEQTTINHYKNCGLLNSTAEHQTNAQQSGAPWHTCHTCATCSRHWQQCHPTETRYTRPKLFCHTTETKHTQ